VAAGIVLPKDVKTRGRMSFEEADHGSVVVPANYTFVYPLVRPGTKGGGPHHRAPRPGVGAPAGKLTVLRYDENVGNTACDGHDGFLHPEFPSQQPTGAPPSGPSADPYDRS
jgi:hypothetical protein